MSDKLLFSEYIKIILHPVEYVSKYVSYIKILEDQYLTGDEKVKRGGGLTVLGSHSIIRDSLIEYPNKLVVHPNASHVIVMNCRFVGPSADDVLEVDT